MSVRGGAALYDAELHPHHHMVCTACGAVTDIDASGEHEKAALSAAREAGFQPDRADTVIRGRCAACIV